MAATPTTPAPPVDFGELAKAAKRGREKRGETADAAVGRALGINRSVRRAGRSVTASCLGCGTKIKARNYPRHRAKCLPLRVEEQKRDNAKAARDSLSQ